MRRVVRRARVVRHELKDRDLENITPRSAIWTEKGVYPEVAEGAIVWVKPPPGVSPELLGDVIAKLKEDGAHVKLLPPDRVDEVLVEQRPEPSVVLGEKDARQVVYELCRELAPNAGVPVEDALREAETYLASVGL